MKAVNFGFWKKSTLEYIFVVVLVSDQGNLPQSNQKKELEFASPDLEQGFLGRSIRGGDPCEEHMQGNDTGAVTQHDPSWWLFESLWWIAAAWIFNFESTPSSLPGGSLHFWNTCEKPLPPLLGVIQIQQGMIAKKLQKKKNFCLG